MVRNLEKARAARKAWRRVNLERDKARQKAWHLANLEKEKARSKAWALANPEKIRAHQLARVNWTLEEYNRAEKEQKGRCAICQQKSDKTLHADHNHENGKRRQLLCGKCNRALGYFDDNIERIESAARYLKFHS
jgi:hypothetical protein